MAYTVCNTSDSGLQVQGSVDGSGRSRVNYTATQGYRVDYTGEDPEDVTEVGVSLLPDIPVVNYTTWYNSNTGLSMPFCVCRSLDISRDPTRKTSFSVTASFATGDLDEQTAAGSPPTAVTDISPIVNVTVGSYQRTMYVDRDGDQCHQLPGTLTDYAEPVMETIPTLSLTIEQFELTMSDQTMLDRSFKLNDASYRGKDAGLWMTGAVKRKKQSVQLASGAVDCYRVVYPLMLSERFFLPPGSSTPTVYGHDAVRPLVDTFIVDGGEVVPNVVNGQIRSGYINTDGTKRTPGAANEERPDYIRHRRQEEISFSFLQA